MQSVNQFDLVAVGGAGGYNGGMAVQYVIVAVLVGGALAYLVIKWFRGARSNSASCGRGACGCSPSESGRLGRRRELIEVKLPEKDST